ncbi:MAG: hypothetical protein ABJE95_38460, partial [Byssovorax sp.]
SLFAAIASAGLFALGCGSSTPAAEHAEEHEQAEHGEKGEHEHGEKGEHPKMAGSVHEFHEVLGPLWHADKSPERTKKTCEAIPAFEQRAATVYKDVPESARAAEPAYHAAAQGLIAAVDELKAECAKPEVGRADFEAKFMAVHKAFHNVMESAH